MKEPTRPTGQDAEWRAVTEPRARPEDGVPREPHPDVLVVEDDEDEVRIIDRAIRRHGMESRFKIVRSGEDALAYLHETVGAEESRGPPRTRVVILDLKLTGIGGQEVLRRVRADEKLCTLPIVVVSSSRSERDVCECYRLGANSFVSKRHGLEPPGERVVEVARYWLDLNQAAAPS